MVGRAIIAPVSLSRAEIARVYLMLGELRTSRAYKTQIPGDYINGH